MKNSRNLKAKWIKVLGMDTGAGMQIATKSVTVEKKVKRKVTVNLQIKKKKPQNND